jgi:hypothetical protein
MTGYTSSKMSSRSSSLHAHKSTSSMTPSSRRSSRRALSDINPLGPNSDPSISRLYLIKEDPEEPDLHPEPISDDPELSDLAPSDHSPVDSSQTADLTDHTIPGNLNSFIIVEHVQSEANILANKLSHAPWSPKNDIPVDGDESFVDHTPHSLPDLLTILPDPIAPIHLGPRQASQLPEPLILSPTETPTSVLFSSLNNTNFVQNSSDSDSDHVPMVHSKTDDMAEIHAKDGKPPYISKSEISHSLVVKYHNFVTSYHKSLVACDAMATEQQTVALIGPKLMNNDKTRTVIPLLMPISTHFSLLSVLLFLDPTGCSNYTVTSISWFKVPMNPSSSTTSTQSILGQPFLALSTSVRRTSSVCSSLAVSTQTYVPW